MEKVTPKKHLGQHFLKDESIAQANFAARRRLFGVMDVQAQGRTIFEQTLEVRQIVRRGNEQHVADTRQHQGRQRVIHQRLVVDGHQLLADYAGKWI
mgnify:CR=1 FL=1